MYVHQNYENDDFSDKKTPKNPYCCSCGKMYKYKQGLSQHKKKCLYNEKENQIIVPDSSADIKSMFMQVMEENKE